MNCTPLPKSIGCYCVTVLTFHPRKQKIRFEDKHPQWAWYSNNTSPSSLQHNWLNASHNCCERQGEYKEMYDRGYRDGSWGNEDLGLSEDYNDGYFQGMSDMEDCS